MSICPVLPVSIELLCDLWSKGPLCQLWQRAMPRGSSPRSLVGSKKDLGRLQVSHAVSLTQDGLFGKACNVLVSQGNCDETWKLLVSKHPKNDCPSVPALTQSDVSLPTSLNLMAILRSCLPLAPLVFAFSI